MKVEHAVPPPVLSRTVANNQAEQGGSVAEKTRRNEGYNSTGRELVPLPRRLPPTVQGARIDRQADQSRINDIRVTALNIRHISPRKISETGYDLYTVGAIGWEEYEMLASQSEFHPDYNKTIGALVGDTAQPDKPQDFIKIWEKRLEFERRYNPENARQIRQTEHLVSVLRQINNPTDLVV